MTDHEELLLERQHFEQIRAHIAHELDQIRRNIRPTRDFAQAVIQSKQRQELGQLEKSFDHPFFAGVTFLEQTRPGNAQSERGLARQESAYIGRFGLFDRTTLTPLVLDWRSPMANLYYDDAFTDVPVYVDGGRILQFDVERKRQFEIAQGELVQFFDSTSVVRTDQLLLARLQERGDARLRDIVETIQAEQNRIIRADARQVLIVQGVAGSGKTTIALHRLSYLAYQHRDQRAFSHFLIIAPNRLFLDYIANVLPDLGVQGVQQFTFADFVKAALPAKWRLVKEPVREDTVLQNLAARVRGALATRQLLDALLERYVARILPSEALALDSAFVMTAEAIATKFYEDYRHYPYAARRKRLVQSLRQWTDDAIRARGAQLDQQAKRIGYQEAQKRQNEIAAKYRQALDRYCARIKTTDVLDLYRKMIANPKNLAWILRRLPPSQRSLLQRAERMLGAEALPQALADYLAAQHKGQRVSEEDLAALLYLRKHLDGLDKSPKFSHVVVDEAQDLAPFELHVLTLFMNQSSMSLFGDLAQTIYERKGLAAWEEITDGVFADEVSQATLRQSYRSTVEIMAAANAVIAHWSYPGKTLAVPVLRHGTAPVAVMVARSQDLVQVVHEMVVALQEDGLHSIAIIDKTAQACKRLAAELDKRECSATLLGEDSDHYLGGVSVVPIHQSKGMEFDAVILVDPHLKKYEPDNDTDIKLLYVAMTRALHRLCAIHCAPLTPLLADAGFAVQTASTAKPTSTPLQDGLRQTADPALIADHTPAP